MSSHPYRQRVPNSDFSGHLDSTSSSQFYSASSNTQMSKSPYPTTDPVEAQVNASHHSLASVRSSLLLTPAQSSGQPQTQLPPQLQSQSSQPQNPNYLVFKDSPRISLSPNNQSPRIGMASPNSQSAHSLHEIPSLALNPLSEANQYNKSTYMDQVDTPPPVFSNGIASPPAQPLSATSSVTNLHLNKEFTRSENNLQTPKFNQHSRSVSSTLSFFDRSDNASIVDFNQNLITQYLGDNLNHLMPRIKTIELYRKNAKKSNDPTVLFQYAQYMLQTALLLDTDVKEGSSTPLVENSPMRGPVDKEHKHLKSKSGNSFDLSNLEDSSLNDKRLKKSLLKEAVVYLRKLSDKGYVDAQYLLGDAYSSGAMGKVDNKDAFLLFQAAAKHGHTESAYRTSYCYEEGLGTGRDARKAIEYLKMAASKNHPAAMYKLGVYSFYGRMGLSQDINVKKMGIKWLTRAANVANELIAAAPYELGKIYFNGFKDIVIQDKKYALELYSQAAALGHIESSAVLGHFYEVGEIVPQDSNLSIHYYTQAALGGDPNSMLAMCAWYLVGNDPFLPKDENESFEWAKRAAMCNLAKGQFALANFYEKGIGCEKNTEEAQKWYIKAAENGDEKAVSRITNKELASKLQKKVKNKRNPSGLTPNVTKNLNFDTKNDAQDKDCVIV